MSTDAANTHEPHSPSHRQSIFGSILRGRPRGASQSRTQPPPPPPPQDHPLDAPPTMSPQPPASNNTSHRRRPAGVLLQSSVSQGLAAPNSNPTTGLTNILRRRRSANGALNAGPAPPTADTALALVAPTRPSTGHPQSAPASAANATHRIRMVPHLDSNRSLHFDPIMRSVKEGDAALRIGRFTDRSGLGVAAANAANTHKLAFKSKVVSRAHAEVWVEAGGKFFIKDTKSSSGTFLNHVRLSPPNAESRPFALKDGDVLQLGVDYQGGTEEIYKCVKMRIEVGREWQAGPNAFNTNAMKQLKALSAQPADPKPNGPSALVSSTSTGSAKSGISDCCICLFGVTVHQSLFIAPCSHVFHYKCIRPLLQMHHPGFSCPMCRTFANLEEDVEVEGEVFAEVEAQTPDWAMEVEGAGLGQPGDDMEVDDAGGTPPLPVLPASERDRRRERGAETEVEQDGAPRRARVGGPHVSMPGVRDEEGEDDDLEEEEGMDGRGSRGSYARGAAWGGEGGLPVPAPAVRAALGPGAPVHRPRSAAGNGAGAAAAAGAGAGAVVYAAPRRTGPVGYASEGEGLVRAGRARSGSGFGSASGSGGEGEEGEGEEGGEGEGEEGSSDEIGGRRAVGAKRKR